MVQICPKKEYEEKASLHVKFCSAKLITFTRSVLQATRYNFKRPREKLKLKT